MENLTGRMERMARKNARRRLWRRFVAAPALLVVFVTTYMLILPAIAKERETYCGLEEHTHTEECFVRELSCGYEEGQIVAEAVEEKTFSCGAKAHEHTDSCEDESGSIVCGYADFLAHKHDDSCYDSAGALVCPLEEHEPHEHTAACYGEKKVNICGLEEAEPHTHTEDCYSVREVQELTCGLEETEGHAHTESCYASHEVSRLVCGQEEDGEHVHTGDCYETETVTELICGQEEAEPHTHTEDCYSTELVRELTCGLEETEGHTHTDECFKTETGLTCGKEEILLHTHTDECYEENEDGEKVLACGKTEILEHVHGPECCTVTERTEERAHAHTDVCYTERAVCGLEEHTHTDACYDEELVEIEEGGAPELLGPELVCGLAEHQHSDACLDENMEYVCGLEAHTHSAACYDGPEAPAAEPELVCELAEHTHGEGCYDEEGALICGLAEHTHGESCYVLPAAPAQHRVLICGKEAHAHTDACYDENMTLLCGFDAHTHTEDCYAMAELSDLVVTCGLTEHTHSAACYDEAGELICGLTEHVHGDGCFALAGPESGEPVLVLYCGMSEHAHGESCYDETGALVCPLEAHKHTKACYMNAAGLSALCGMVEHTHNTTCYDENGELICGLEEHTHTAPCFGIEVRKILSCTLADGSTISVSAPANFFPAPERAESLTLKVEELAAESDEYAEASQLLESQAELTGHRLFDISIMDGDAAVQPLGNVTVSFLNVMEAGAPANVYHVDLESGSVEDMGARTDEDGVFMTTPHFSLYDIMTAPAAGSGRLRGGVSDEPLPEPDEVQPEEETLPQEDEVLPADEPAPIAEDGLYDIATIATTDVRAWSSIGTTNGMVYKLQKDITATSTKTINNATITIDLNGYTLKVGTSNNYYVNPFSVGSGGKLIITDSSGNWKTPEETTTGGGEKYKAAALSGTNLTYYVTTSAPNEEGTGTDEGVVTHSVSLAAPGTGMFTGASQSKPLVIVNSGGSLEIQGGTLQNTNCTAIEVKTKGTVTLNGGHIIGSQANNGNYFVGGGAIHVDTSAKDTVINIESGVIRGCTARYGGAIYGAGSGSSNELNISGGYIVGNTAPTDSGYTVYETPWSNYNGSGGAIDLRGGWTLTMTGGVIAGNTAKERGGGIYSSGAAVKIQGGIIAGNVAQGEGCGGTGLHAYGGGGIYIRGALLTISDGYITNNQATGDYWIPKFDGYNSQGGGGVLAEHNSASVEMSGGYVTGNYAANAAGGIFLRTGTGGYGTFKMTGGYVSGNYAGLHEAGGIYIDCYGQRGIIDPSAGMCYITNNESNTQTDWGGGGIFLGGGSTLTIYKALITENEAGGFGGGVGGCPTGRVFLNKELGGAVYDNTAQGVNLSSGSKSEDHYAAASTLFMNGGYQDYFCALASIVQKGMLGGGASNWKGSADNMAVDTTGEADGYLEADTRMGLTASPDNDARAAAKNTAGVIISGNISNTHGGGIMTNGTLTFGHGKKYSSTGSTLEAYKTLKKNNSNKKEEMTAGQFTFVVTDEAGKIVSRGQSTLQGFIDGIVFPCPNFWGDPDSPATKTFYLKEEIPDETGGITYDDTVYKIVFHIASVQGPLGLDGISETRYYFDKVNSLQYSEKGEPGPYKDFNYTYKAGGLTSRGVLTLGNSNNNAAFMNTDTGGKRGSLGLIKYSHDETGAESMPMQDVTFELTKEGDEAFKQSQTTRWDGLAQFSRLEAGTYHLREVLGEANKDYFLEGPWIVEVTDPNPKKSNVALNVKLYKATVTEDASGNEVWTKEGEALVGKTLPFIGGEAGGDTGRPPMIDVYVYEITNELKRDMYELPKSGGEGTLAYTLSGLALIALAGGLYCRRRRKGHQEL